MDQHINIGSVSLYEDNGSGYEYSKLFRPQDYVVGDATINISDNMGFGASMDIHDNHVIIGCPNEEPNDDDGNPVWANYKLGSVFVFDKDTGDLIQRIIPDNTVATWTEGSLSGVVRKQYNFGYSVAASEDDFIVIGAPGYTANIGSTVYNYSGRAYVYVWNSGTEQYDLAYTITPASRISNNRFGDTVLVDGESVVVSNSPVYGSANPGIVRYITLNSTRTGSTNDVKITNTHGSWKYSLAADSGRVAVGLHRLDTVNIYTIVDGIARLDYNITEDKLASFEFGYDLEFDEDKILVGCPNGYYKLGVVLRLGKVSGEYTLV